MKEKLARIKSLLYFALGSYTEYFVGLIISILIARALSPSEYGLYSFLIWLSALGVILVNNGLSTAVIKFIAEERGKKNDVSAVFKYLRNIQLKFAVAVCIILVLASYQYGYKISTEIAPVILYLAIAAIFFKSTYMFYVSVAKGYENFRLLASSVLIVSPVNLILVYVIGQYYSSLGLFITVYFSISLLYFIVMLFLQRKVRFNAKTNISDELKKRVLLHVKTVSVNVILGFIIFKQSEVAFLKLLSSTENVAFYNVGFMLASSAMLLVPGVFSALLLPIMSKAGVSEEGRLDYKFLTATRYLFFLTLPVIIIGILLSEQLISILYGSKYILSSEALRICLVASGVAVVAQSAISLLMSTDNQKEVMKIFLLIAGINVFLDVVLISRYELAGAYFANLVASMLLSFLLIYKSKTNLGVSLEYGKYAKLLILALGAAFPLFFAVKFGSLLVIFLTLILYIPIYLVGSVLFKCWSPEDTKLFFYVSRKFFPSLFITRYFERMCEKDRSFENRQEITKK